MHPLFADAFSFLENPDLANYDPGKFVLIEDKLIAIIAHESGRVMSAGKLEAHRQYIDIQYLISGDESMGWASTSLCEPMGTYDATRDLLFFKNTPTTQIKLLPDMFTIFYPHDAHLPLVGNGPIKKVILKVAVEA
jgi:YhcH/YjgK/YiaL family protein